MLAKQIMLVNVKFFKKIFLIFIILTANLYANERDQIIYQLNSLNSMEFTFDQWQGLYKHAEDKNIIFLS